MNPAQNQTFLIPNDSPYDFQSAFVGGKKKVSLKPSVIHV